MYVKSALTYEMVGITDTAGLCNLILAHFSSGLYSFWLL